MFGVFTEAKQQRVDDLPKHLHEHRADTISNYNDQDESEHGKRSRNARYRPQVSRQQRGV
jgi:hypothetical protein